MFTREDTKAVKGLAVVLMLLHHLACYSFRFPLDFPGFTSLIPGFVENGYLTDIALNALICVPLFFFLGGYGLYKRWENGGFRLLNALLDLYKKYWRVFIVFVPVAFLFFVRPEGSMSEFCTRYIVSSPKQFLTDLLTNFTGYAATFNSEWWFFGSYVCVLPLGCLFCMGTGKHRSFLTDLFLVFAIHILTQGVFPALTSVPALGALGGNLFYYRFLELNKFAPVFFCGVVFAKYDGLVRIKALLGRGVSRTLLGLAGALAVFICRAWVMTDMDGADVILVPLFAAFVSALFDGAEALKLGFSFLGKHSTNMWLVHSFFCYYFLECTKLVYCTGCVWIDLAVLTALSLGASVLLELFYGGLSRLVRGRKKVLVTN